MSWLTDQMDSLREFIRTDFRRILLFCTIGFFVSVIIGAVIAFFMPDIVITVFDNFMNQIQESGVIDENGNMSVFSLLLNNWRAMSISALYGFVPFLYLPLISLFVNGAMLGMLAALYHSNRVSLLVFLAGILPHGIFEIPALVISIACGIYLCRSMCRFVTSSPKREPLIELFSDLLRVMLLAVMPMVIIAAVIESYITPVIMGFFL